MWVAFARSLSLPPSLLVGIIAEALGLLESSEAATLSAMVRRERRTFGWFVGLLVTEFGCFAGGLIWVVGWFTWLLVMWSVDWLLGYLVVRLVDRHKHPCVACNSTPLHSTADAVPPRREDLSGHS